MLDAGLETVPWRRSVMPLLLLGGVAIASWAAWSGSDPVERYPAEVRNEFVGECVATGMSFDECTCVVADLERTTPSADLPALRVRMAADSAVLTRISDAASPRCSPAVPS